MLKMKRINGQIKSYLFEISFIFIVSVEFSKSIEDISLQSLTQFMTSCDMRRCNNISIHAKQSKTLGTDGITFYEGKRINSGRIYK